MFYARVAEIKLASGCVDCGYDRHPDALDFDHVRGEKLFHVSRGCSLPWRSVMDEIGKCEVVCANCHRVRTAERRGRDDPDSAPLRVGGEAA